MLPRLLVSILLVACSKPPASPPQHPAPAPATATATASGAAAPSVPHELDQIGGDPERPTIAITSAGVYYGHQKLERIADALSHAHEAMPTAFVPVFVFANAPVAAIVDTLGAVPRAGWTRADVYTVDGDRRRLLCGASWADPVPDPKESVTLSIELLRERTWVGVSMVNEFDEVPTRDGEQDFDKLETILEQHRASAFFADRRDAQLAFDAGITTAVALHALEIACNADFKGFHLVAPGELAARAKP